MIAVAASCYNVVVFDVVVGASAADCLIWV